MTAGINRRAIPAPIVNPESEPYWDAAQQQKLLIKFCTACAKYHFYPRTLCPFCFSDKTEWREASGKGSLYTHSTMRRIAPIPYTLAYVELEEGPRMAANVVDCDNTKLAIGQALRVVFKPAEDGKLVPCWTPA